MPDFFIRRPIFAWVVALLISLIGLLAIPSLPIAQYPDIAPPVITLRTTYPGRLRPGYGGSRHRRD